MLQFREMIDQVDQCNRIADLLDAAGIPGTNAGIALTLSQRVEEALARLRARGGAG